MSISTLDVRGLCIKFAVHRNKSSGTSSSSRFLFQGNKWSFCYWYTGDGQHILGLEKWTNADVNPFEVSVQLECGETKSTGLMTQVTRFTDEFKTLLGRRLHIWEKQDIDILLTAAPSHYLSADLNFIVVLKREEVDSLNPAPAGCDPSVLETKCIAPEAAGLSTRSISVQTTLLPNTTPCLESLLEDLGQLMVEGSDHDVEFQFEDQSIKAHKSIVCSRSPVIASMLSSDMVEGRTGVVKIPDMEPELFKHFLRYIYCGQLPELSVDLAITLYESGDQYEVLGLAKRCSEYLVEHVSKENACRLLIVADAHTNEDLKEMVIGFMLEEEIPLSGGDWQDFCDAHPKIANEVLNRFCLRFKRR